MKKIVALVVLFVFMATSALAMADESWFEDEFIIITADGAMICYEDEFVKMTLYGKIDIFNAYFVDAEELIPCEVIEAEDGIYIRLFSFENYNVTEEIWRCTWC